MLSFVIDTNFFINLQRPLNLGNNKEEVVVAFHKLALPLIKKQLIVLYTTPNSFKELSAFYQDDTQTIKLLSELLTIGSYNSNKLQIQAHLFYKLIEQAGKRLYRGLRVAEEPLKELLGNDNYSKTDINTKINQLREKYRRATREGFLDSTIDLELILLCKDRDAVIVSTDRGLLEWARDFGCNELLPELFVNKLKALGQASNFD